MLRQGNRDYKNKEDKNGENNGYKKVRQTDQRL